MMLIAVHVWIVYIIFVIIKSSFGKCIKNFKYWLHDRHEMQYETWQHLIGYMFLVDFNISVIFFFTSASSIQFCIHINGSQSQTYSCSKDTVDKD